MDNMDIPGDILTEGFKLSDLLDKGVTITLDNNPEKRVYDYYENDFFETPSRKESYERGAPGEQSFEEISARMTNVDDTGLIKKALLKQGYGAKVAEGAHVLIHYNGFWDGENVSFDSTLLREDPKSFIIGEGEILPGIEEAVKTMTQGEEAEFLVSYTLLFGEAGCPPRVRPKADALFYINVVRVIEHYKDSIMYKSQQSTEKKFEDVYKYAKSLHQNGLEAFKLNNLEATLKYFHKAVNIMEFSQQSCEAEQEMQKALLIKLYTNLAVCYNKRNNPKRACIMCNELARITNINTNCKVLYQKAIALQNLGEYERAKALLMKAKNLKPTDEDINKRLINLVDLIEQETKQEKAICAKIFNLKPDQNPSKKDETLETYQNKKLLDIVEQFQASNSTELTLSLFLSTNDVNYIKVLLSNPKYKMTLQKVMDNYILKKK